MNERKETFTVGERPTLSVDVPSGQITVQNGPTGVVEVTVDGKRADEFTINQVGDSISVSLQARGFIGSSQRIGILAPTSIRVDISCASADVIVDQAAQLDVRLASGDVRAEHISGDLSHKSASGDLLVGTVAGRATSATTSGDVSIELAESDCELTTVSGDIAVKTAMGDFSAKSVSGDLRVIRFAGSRFDGKTTSGDIKISVPKGSVLDVDLLSLSGRCSVPESSGESSNGALVDIVCKSVSGDVVIRTRKDPT